MNQLRARGLSRPLTAFIAVGAAAAVVLSGCSTTDGDNGGESTDGASIPWNASLEEYAAALADMDPVTLIWDSGAAGPENPRYVAQEEFLDTIERGSGGRITIETNAAGAIAAIPEVDDAVIDGRLDFGTVFPQYDPSEYPVANLFINITTTRDPRLVTGTFANAALLLDVGWNTPELLSEWADKGLTPLNLIDGQGVTALACREPVHTLADLNGKLVRSGSTTASRELEALGATPVSLPYAEMYEALQRGIIDCGITALVIIIDVIDVAPHVIVPSTTSFASVPTTAMAGERFRQLPPEARQLLERAFLTYNTAGYGGDFDHFVSEGLSEAAERGGGISTFATEVDDRLIALHEEFRSELQSSSLVDGNALVERIDAARAKWVGLVEELGYVDGGPVEQFAEWADPAVYGDLDRWLAAVYEEILLKR